MHDMIVPRQHDLVEVLGRREEPRRYRAGDPITGFRICGRVPMLGDRLLERDHPRSKGVAIVTGFSLVAVELLITDPGYPDGPTSVGWRQAMGMLCHASELPIVEYPPEYWGSVDWMRDQERMKNRAPTNYLAYEPQVPIERETTQEELARALFERTVGAEATRIAEFPEGGHVVEKAKIDRYARVLQTMWTKTKTAERAAAYAEAARLMASIAGRRRRLRF